MGSTPIASLKSKKLQTGVRIPVGPLSIGTQNQMEKIPLKPLIERLRRMPEHLETEKNHRLFSALGNAIADVIEGHGNDLDGREFAEAYHGTLDLVENGLLNKKYPGIEHLRNTVLNNLFRLAFPFIAKEMIPREHVDGTTQRHLELTRQRANATARRLFGTSKEPPKN